MQRLAVYFEVGTEMWRPEEDWAALPVEDWDKHFQPGISVHSTEGDAAPSAYVLQPIDGQLAYLRRGPNVRNDESQAVQEVDLQVDAVSLQVTRECLLSLYSNKDGSQERAAFKVKHAPASAWEGGATDRVSVGFRQSLNPQSKLVPLLRLARACRGPVPEPAPASRPVLSFLRSAA